MADKLASDEVQVRAAAAIMEAQSGSNHQAGADGDDESVADRAAQKKQQALRFDALRGSALAWMMRLAHSRAVDRVRSAQSSSMRDTDFTASAYRPDVDGVVEDVLGRAERSSVRDALQRLNAGQRQAIVMAYFGGMTTAEIAAETGVNRSTIKSRIRDGLLKLAVDLRGAEATDSLVL